MSPMLNFSVDSALLSELGERLVESVHIALAELIKNAYDADATKVTVQVLKKGDESDIEIVISDDGLGMTFNEIEKYWMRIATTNKADNQYSQKFGRPRTGSKGIGRFSCRRLGTKLELVSTAKLKSGKYQTTKVVFNWLDYVPGGDITEIGCEGTKKTSNRGRAGTKLVIRGKTADEWTQRRWYALKKHIVLLVANRGAKRKGYDIDPGFKVDLAAPYFEDEDIVNPREQMMDAGWGKLTITVNSSGLLKCTLEAKTIGTKEIIHNTKFKQLAGTKAVIAIIPDNKSQLRDTKNLSKTNINEILKNWGGIYVRYRGARVYPFGELHNDWLGIDYERGLRKGRPGDDLLVEFADTLRGVNSSRSLLNMLSSRAYIGDVELSSQNTNLFVMKASREGFVGSKGIDLLRKIVRFGVDWSTIYRDYYLRITEEDNHRIIRNDFEGMVKQPVKSYESIEKAGNFIKGEVKRFVRDLPIEDRSEASYNIVKATDLILKRDNLSRQESRHLKLIASTSSLMHIFAHEVKSLLGNLNLFSAQLSSIHKHVDPKHRSKVLDMKDTVSSTKKRFKDLLSMTQLISVDSKKAKPLDLALKTKVKKAVECYQLVTKAYSIEIDYSSVSNSFKTGKILEAELFSILLNALSNSIKSVIAKGKVRKIKITAKKIARKTHIFILDNGIGVPFKDSEELFVPFVADPSGKLYSKLKKNLNSEDKFIVGSGSGLGLSIIKEIVLSRNGDVHFNKPPKGWNAELEIIIP